MPYSIFYHGLGVLRLTSNSYVLRTIGKVPETLVASPKWAMNHSSNLQYSHMNLRNFLAVSFFLFIYLYTRQGQTHAEKSFSCFSFSSTNPAQGSRQQSLSCQGSDALEIVSSPFLFVYKQVIDFAKMTPVRKFNDYNMWWVREVIRGGDEWSFDWDFLDEEDEDDWVTAVPAVEGTNEEMHDEWYSYEDNDEEENDDEDEMEEDVEGVLYG